MVEGVSARLEKRVYVDENDKYFLVFKAEFARLVGKIRGDILEGKKVDIEPLNSIVSQVAQNFIESQPNRLAKKEAAILVRETLRPFLEQSSLAKSILNWNNPDPRTNKSRIGNCEVIQALYDYNEEEQRERHNVIAEAVRRGIVDCSAAEAVRNRRIILGEIILSLAREVENGTPLKVTSLACGACQDLGDVFKIDQSLKEKIEFNGYDQDKIAIDMAKESLGEGENINLQEINVFDLFKKWHEEGTEPQDLIYSAGLMDYINPLFFRKLVGSCKAALKPDGLLILGNFGPNNPNKDFMDVALGWRLIHRTPEELKKLIKPKEEENVLVFQEPEGVNLFVVYSPDKNKIARLKQAFENNQFTGSLAA